MQSHDVLRQAIEPVGVKLVARKVGVSAALVYKWCQPFDAADPATSGARNPLDRLALIHEVTQDAHLVNWLCHHAGGFFVNNPAVKPRSLDTRLLAETQQLVQEFSELLSTVTHAIADDGAIQPVEAERIRNSWEQLKSSCEEFATACEKGHFDRAAKRPG